MGAEAIIKNMIFGITIANVAVFLETMTPIPKIKPFDLFGLYGTAIGFTAFSTIIWCIVAVIACVSRFSQKVSALIKIIFVAVAAASLFIADILFLSYALSAETTLKFGPLRVNLYAIVTALGILFLYSMLVIGLLFIKRKDKSEDDE
ncbi:unnamed protein product [Caenorhabditis angaria]|uniref:Uncharacterized protein n=1 Tax=Caenorhabditis angaria TaxID=860376 RepID=A0A9P1IF03_9PELO|nr:unnamed protein product [Caenorhabditis angaria]